MFELAGNRPPLRLVYTGGCWLYPAQTHPAINEETPFDPLATFTYMVEHRARILQAGNIHLTTIHPGIVWSETGGFYNHYRTRIEAGNSIQVVGSSETLWPHVHVDDLATLYALSLTESATTQDYLGVADAGLPIRNLIQRIADNVGKPVMMESIPVAQAIQEKGEWAAGQARSQRIVSGKAKKDLGWRPTRFFGGDAGMDRHQE